MFNKILTTATYPSIWRHAIITPISKLKTGTVSDFNDLRPISVTSLLARVFERLVIRFFIFPKLPSDALINQFALKPTGSTTATLVSLNHHVTNMLETNSYVHCLCIDFSKAFDTINHKIILDKLGDLDIHPSIVALISSFLYGRTQSTRLNGFTSNALPITRSIVQGSGFGPVLYIIYASDLKTLCESNKLLLYADDNKLLVPQTSLVCIADEFKNIQYWALVNKLMINLIKTIQLIFRRPNINLDLLSHCLPDIELVECIKLLGIYVSSTFNQSEQVNSITLAANQRLYLLKTLKLNGMNSKQLDCIFHAVVMSKIIYAIEAWGGFVAMEMAGIIDKMFKKAKRWGLTTQLFNFKDVKDERCNYLFKKVCKNPDHCLFHLLPPLRPMIARLRPRKHDHQIPSYSTALHRKSFLTHSLLKGGITAT